MIKKYIDKYYMQQAIILATRGKFTVSPNPMVGCVLVKNGNIISEGWHNIAGDDHAEIIAISKAGNKSKNSTMYINLEPCCFYGKTGPCVDAIINANIKKVIIANIDPNPKVSGKGVEKLKNAGILVEIGLLKKQSEKLNKIFFHYQITKKPFVYAKIAMSLDGKISTNKNDKNKISSDKAFIYTHKLRNICDAILIGKKTLLNDNPKLNVRININKIKHPTRFILFNNLININNHWQILDQSYSKTIFICSKISIQAKNTLNKLGIKYWLLSKNNNKISPNNILKKMGNMGLTSLLVEGGMKTINHFLDENLINEFYTYLAPVLISNYKKRKQLNFNKIFIENNDIIINSNFKE